MNNTGILGIKINFPTGVELPLRSGYVVVLHEFFKGYWWGRHTDKDYPRSDWIHTHWSPEGKDLKNASTCRFDIVRTPPKRKAWIVWGDEAFKSALFTRAEAATGHAARYGGVVQEVEES